MAEMLSCFIIARQPAPTLYLNDQDANAADWMQSRLRVLWENVPPVLAKLSKDETGKKSGTVQTEDMTFWCLGAFNDKNLQRRSIRWLVGDETWLWPQGHMAEASARVTSFGWLGKRIFMSQGSFVGDDTEAIWKTTDQREWSFACPKCQHRQAYEWKQLRIPDTMTDDGDYDYNRIKRETAYECEGCKHQFADTRSNRDDFNATGFYAKTNALADSANVGFRWNALCARSWGGLAEMYLRAKLSLDLNGDSKAMQIFKQKQLAQFWSDEPDDFHSLGVIGEYKQGDDWEREARIDPTTKKIHSDHARPNQVKARFMTVDVQREGFFILIRGWAEGGDSRLLKWKYVTTWEDVVAMGKVNEVHPALTYIDCGDQFDDVIRNCGMNKWTALRGDQRNEFAWMVDTKQGRKSIAKVYSPSRMVNVGTGIVKVHHFSNLALKDQLSRLRKIGKHSAPADVGQDYIDQMESEVRVKNLAGKPEWKRIGKRANHLWDCEVMQFVPALAFGFLAPPPAQPVTKMVEPVAPSGPPMPKE
jgi:phage terminase large subunit GpA-like protein